MRIALSPLALAAALALPLAAAPASAFSVIGHLANVDAVNNTGHSAHGFGIELEHSSLWDNGTSASQRGSSHDAHSVFGPDRNVGPLPGTQGTRFGNVAVRNPDVQGKIDGGELVAGRLPAHQIAGFNADPAKPPLAAMPEAQTWAILGAGLLALGGLRHRSRQS